MAERPTFHESWYRVKQTRPRLRAVVQAFRHRYRGQVYFMVRDPGTNQFFRLHESSYHFIGLLDGQRTLDEAWMRVSETHGDDAPTQGEAISLLGQLYTSNLLTADLPPDAQGLFDRYRKRRRREVSNYLMSLFFAKIPLLDPDRFLGRTLPLVSWLFGPVGMVLWGVLVAAGLWSVVGRWEELRGSSSSVLAANNLLLLYAAGAVTKLSHELGHGYACKRHGKPCGSDEVHTLGVMFVALIPMPYVDATSAWAIPSKWKRAFVSAAGMYVEIALAAVAAIIWSRSSADTMLHGFCYNLMFLASVTTLLFNANPLIKFDGYFILADLLEMPNLQVRATQMFNFCWKKLVFGVRDPQLPTIHLPEALFMLVYAVAGSVYRIFISLSMAVFVAGQMFFIGVMIALWGLASFIVMPTYKFVEYLATNPELDRSRGRAWITTGVLAAAVLLLVGLIRLPEYGRVEAVVEPAEFAVIHSVVEGTVAPDAHPLGRVRSGDDVLVRIVNDRLPTELDKLKAQLAEAQVQRRLSERDDLATAQAYDAQVDALQEAIVAHQQRLAQLTRRAPLDGVWVPDESVQRPGHPVRPGDVLGMLYVSHLDGKASPNDLLIRGAADQYLGPRLTCQVSIGQPVEMRIKGRPEVLLHGTVKTLSEAGQRHLPSEALSATSGGSLSTDPQQPQPATVAPHFQLVITPAPAPTPGPGSTPGSSPGTGMRQGEPALLPGQRVIVRLRLDNSTLLERGYRATRQLLQRRFAI